MTSKVEYNTSPIGQYYSHNAFLSFRLSALRYQVQTPDDVTSLGAEFPPRAIVFICHHPVQQHGSYSYSHMGFRCFKCPKYGPTHCKAYQNTVVWTS